MIDFWQEINKLDFQNQNKQAILMLVYSELIFNQLDSDYTEIIRNSLNLCWKWIEHQNISADTIYSTLDDGTDFGGIYILMQLDGNDNNILKLDNIVYAISYISLLAYQKENSKCYLPSILENIDEDTIKSFMENLSKMNLLHIDSYQEIVFCIKNNLLTNYKQTVFYIEKIFLSKS
ncbi:Imm6 family immunity protein [Conchiformibius steedae DSM 2580]|uniref:Imm6 family immunity protein n=1 Tax=Conchiformibius steedae DSM 2580 TaxID=1121352 RepID=A0AAE9HUI2_9NEIS|nr:Imm6 family immunity protein [Conchiformibius steedae]QMT33708.1 hypothetical protein H3L98_01305 [Conchiformibius steedae]URD68369.1 Imm6 family immunity protein [Conchiformibius steedae DSM 2580]